MSGVRGSMAADREKEFKWEHRFLELAVMVSNWSKDPGTRCGAVIIDRNRRILSTGYNGFASGVEDSISRLMDRPTKLACTLHAEENAILFSPVKLDDAKMIVSAHPCAACAARIIQSGISEVAFRPGQADYEARWADNIAVAREQFREAGVYVHPVGRDTTIGEHLAEG